MLLHAFFVLLLSCSLNAWRIHTRGGRRGRNVALTRKACRSTVIYTGDSMKTVDDDMLYAPSTVAPFYVASTRISNPHSCTYTDNEYSQLPPEHEGYFAQIEDLYRSNGIVVPLYVIALYSLFPFHRAFSLSPYSFQCILSTSPPHIWFSTFPTTSPRAPTR